MNECHQKIRVYVEHVFGSCFSPLTLPHPWWLLLCVSDDCIHAVIYLICFGLPIHGTGNWFSARYCLYLNVKFQKLVTIVGLVLGYLPIILFMHSVKSRLLRNFSLHLTQLRPIVVCVCTVLHQLLVAFGEEQVL